MKSKVGRYGIECTLRFGRFHPGYWKMLAHLQGNRSTVVLDDVGLRFTDYPFEPASVFPTGRISTDQIAEVDCAFPPQVRLKTGEILFVPQPSKAALMTLVNRYAVPIVRRRSVWSALLDPFLDTWEEQTVVDEQFAWFASIGLDRRAVDRWRREVAVAMVAYNFGTGLWEWGGLDLHDVLLAQHARLSRRAFADFYWRAIELAKLDPILPHARLPTAETIESALHSVLIEWCPRTKTSELQSFESDWKKRSDQVDQMKSRLLSELCAAYAQPHRHYHTKTHIEQCLSEVGNVWNYAVHLNELRWAILFHDAVYDPQRHDNEARSADWACQVMAELKRPEDEQARVRALIMATAHSAEPRTADQALLLDIDLSILGASEAAFDDYDRAIRLEYEWVPIDRYCEARARVLETFVKRDTLYQTAHYRTALEASARQNLQRALLKIQTKSTDVVP